MKPDPGPALAKGGATWLFVGTWCVALEYVLWPTEAPGGFGGPVWSFIGNLLLAALALALLFELAVPLWRLLRRRLDSSRHWIVFVALWAASVLFWMWMSSEISLPPTGSSGASGVVLVPLATPFGLLPSALFTFPGGLLQGYLSPLLGLFGLLGFLWSGAALAGFLGRAVPRRSRGVSRADYSAGIAGTVSWLPGLGFSMYCCSSPPLLGALLLAGAPSGWVGAYGNLAPFLNGVWLLLSVLAVVASVHLAIRNRGPFLRSLTSEQPAARYPA